MLLLFGLLFSAPQRLDIFVRNRKRPIKPENLMRLTKLQTTAFLFALLQLPHATKAQSKIPEADAGKTLSTFFEAEWDYEMEQNPTRASSLGDRGWNDRWPDRSLEAIRKDEEHTTGALTRLNKIDRAHLSPADQLNYDLFKKDLETEIEGAKFRTYLMPINQRGGLQTLDELGDRLRFETIKDYEDWIARLRSLPVLVEQEIALMREGARAHVMWPKIVLNRVPAQIDKQLVAKPDDSPFYKPLKKFPDSIPRQIANVSLNPRATPSPPACFPHFKSSKNISWMNICQLLSTKSASGKCRKALSSTLISRDGIRRPP
jgi:hypothetical protein